METVVRNYAAGSISKRLRIPEGEKLRRPIVEFYYKSDALGDPLLTEDHIEILDLASQEEVELLKTKALEVNKVLTELFAELGVKLIDFKLEFGRDSQGNVLPVSYTHLHHGHWQSGSGECCLVCCSDLGCH